MVTEIKDIKIFGLQETVKLESIFFSKVIPVPSKSLLNILNAQDLSNFSVGIELESTEKIIRIPPLEWITPDIYLILFDYFKNKGNTISFLESREYLEQEAHIHQKISSLRKQLDYVKSREEKSLIRSAIFKQETEAQYIHLIGKEEIIIRNILSKKPDLIFIGDGHARRFYKRKEDFLKRGINIKEYWQETITRDITESDVYLAAKLCTEKIPIEKELENILELRPIETEIKKVECSSNDIEEYPDFIIVDRLYNAMKKGRITKKSPNFIGTWDLERGFRGLFEMFVEYSNNGKIYGTIEDCFGSATFNGKIEGNKIHFIKIYEKPFTSLVATKAISYTGFLKNNSEYIGVYTMEQFGEKGDFKMKRIC